MYLTLSSSVCFSFDAIVYDSTKPKETLVSSPFKSREHRQEDAISEKNAKNLHKSEKTLNLNEMRIYTIKLKAKAQSKKL